MKSSGIATISPKAVVSSASATPLASIEVLPSAPLEATLSNALISPVTVPSSPSSGATLLMIPITRPLRRRS
ncbi:MAG: hypothetical protein M5U26_00250 [Planctomycetota bacterium]|nr:hypothetical protein [Planctomycetota bacterium]